MSEWPFKPVLYMDDADVYAAMPDPDDLWLWPPYWRHVPESYCWTHPYPRPRGLGESLFTMT